MANWFDNLQTSSLLAGAMAVGASVVLPGYVSAEWLAAVGGFGTNLLSNFAARFFNRRETDPRRPDLNHDLLKLLSKAITREIATVEREEGHTLTAAERRCLVVFLGKAGDAFERLVHNNTLPHIAPPDVQQLLTDAARSQSFPPVGTVEEWQQIVRQLNRDCQAGLEDTTETLLAQRLHTRLWEALHSELKQDFAGEGRAYAALHLGFMGDVLATLNELVRLPREQSQLTQELLNELRAHKARAADPKQEAIVAALAPEEQRRLAPLSARLDSLSAQLDAQIGRVLGELGKMERSAWRRYRVVVALLVVALLGVGVLWRGQTRIADNVGDLGGLVDRLSARLSEKDQEIGTLKARLAAALQRAEQAGAAGNTTASDALAQIRKDGNPKELGVFLDQQLAVAQPRLAEQQANVVQLLRERAAVAYISGEIARAEQCLQQILAALPNDLSAINELGHIYKLRGDLDAASRQYRRLLDLAPNDQEVKAVALGNLGLIAQTRGQLDEAERLHREPLTINQQLGRLEGQASDLGNLGLIARTRGQLDEAERLLRESLAINRQLGRLEGQANQLGNLGLIAQTRGQLDEAERLHRESLTINQQLGRLEGQANQLGNLGLIAQTRGQLGDAALLHREALAIHQQLGRLEGQADALGNLGLIAGRQGQIDDAERLLRETLAIEQQLGRLQGQADALGNLGLVAQIRGQLDDAEGLHREALAIDQQLGNLEGQARALGNLGLIAGRWGQLDKAVRLHREALAIDQQLGYLRGQARHLGNLGLIAQTRGNIAEARRLWTEARDVFAREGVKPMQEQVQEWLDGLPPEQNQKVKREKAKRGKGEKAKMMSDE